MKSLNKIIYLVVFLSGPFLFFSSCKQEPKVEEQTSAPGEDMHQEIVVLSPLQYQAAEIKLGNFEQKNLSDFVKASGTLDLPPQNKAGVSSLINGKITKINVVQGDKVRKGEVLALIENPEIIQLQKNYLEAKSGYGYAHQEYLRQKELYEEKIVSGKKYQAALADDQAKKALVNSLENQLRQIGISSASVSEGNFTKTIPVTTPIDGYITTISVKTGSYINATQEIFSVVDNDHIHADFQVFEKDVPKVKEGQKILFTVRGSDSIYEANIFSVGKAFDQETRSVAVHAEIEGRHSLLPGMYVEGRIQTGEKKVTALPNDAIVKEGSKDFIFFKADSASEYAHQEETLDSVSHASHEEEEEIIFKKVQVKTGVSDLGYTQVIPLEKIPAQSGIVVKGAYFLLGQMKKEEGGEGDAHGH